MICTSTPWRCGVCRKELRGVWAVLMRKPFPVCSTCRLMVHHVCLAQADPPMCRRCAGSTRESTG
jgi:hypothetical protein